MNLAYPGAWKNEANLAREALRCETNPIPRHGQGWARGGRAAQIGVAGKNLRNEPNSFPSRTKDKYLGEKEL